MEQYSERAQQEAIQRRLRSRDNGFVPVVLAGNETIPGMFARQVALHRHRAAVVSPERSVTYEELERLARSAAGSISKRTKGERTPIAVLIADPIYFAACVLGILQTGGSYVPLDPAFPAERNARILQQSQAKYIVTEGAQRELLRDAVSPQQTLMDAQEIANSAEWAGDASQAGDAACVIFTSGSTGRPKGVVQTHRNVLQVVRRYTHSLYLGFEDRVSLLSSCSVTASVGTILGSLLNGATLCAFGVREQGLLELADWLDRERITIYRSVPSLFRHLMQTVAPQRIFPTVQIVRLGGDSLHKTDWQLFAQHFSGDCVFVNFYGCSEMSTVARFYMDASSRLSEGVLPVGYPLDDVQIAVVDAHGILTWVRQQPPEQEEERLAVGEIVLKSRYLSPGYWQDSAATDAAFKAADWERDGVRSYHTGDLGSIRGGQGLVHVGRADSQVKVSGFRVEIAEVEACLRSCEGVRDAAVSQHRPSHGERELVGFVTVAAESARSGQHIRTELAARLPAHMVPSEILVLEEIPSTPNGKIDRAALVRVRQHMLEAKVRSAPETYDEQRLAEIWRDVLDVEHVGRDDDFFELGGNSLLGLKLAARLVEEIGVPLQTLAVFQHPTVSQLARHIASLHTDQPHLRGSSHRAFEERTR